MRRSTGWPPSIHGRAVSWNCGYFGGLTVEEAAVCLGISTATVKREMRLARAWLQNELSDGGLPERDDGS